MPYFDEKCVGAVNSAAFEIHKNVYSDEGGQHFTSEVFSKVLDTARETSSVRTAGAGPDNNGLFDRRNGDNGVSDSENGSGLSNG